MSPGPNVLDVYRILVGVVTPRPIAWVTSVDLEGRVNLAPFSFFNAFGANPPVVVFSPTLRRDGGREGHAAATSRRPASSCSTPPSSRWPSR